VTAPLAPPVTPAPTPSPSPSPSTPTPVLAPTIVASGARHHHGSKHGHHAGHSGKSGGSAGSGGHRHTLVIDPGTVPHGPLVHRRRLHKSS
jgi:hypothetical protein